jgi:hypothetical protein
MHDSLNFLSILNNLKDYGCALYNNSLHFIFATFKQKKIN